MLKLKVLYELKLYIPNLKRCHLLKSKIREKGKN